MPDPRPADLTAQGPTVDMSSFNTLDVAHGMHGLLILLMNGKPVHEVREKLEPWRNRLAELSDAQKRSDEGCGAEGCGPFGCRVCSSATPSRGQGAAEAWAADTVEAIVSRDFRARLTPLVNDAFKRARATDGELPDSRPFVDATYTLALEYFGPRHRSPAPVASPEAETCICAVDPRDDHPRDCSVHPNGPAGPETGWLTMAKDASLARVRHASMWYDEAVALRSALSAATERAAADHEQCAKNASTALRLGVERNELRTQLAAALKLAGEATEALHSAGNEMHEEGLEAKGEWRKRMADDYRARLAALSSPSAPESGTQGEADADS